MGFFEDVDRALRQQEEEARAIPVYDTVAPLHDIAPKMDEAVVGDVVAVELCVLSCETHSRGWRYVLLDKEAVNDFTKAKAELAQLSRELRDTKVFHINVLQPKREQRESQVCEPGDVFSSKSVSNFTNYKGSMPQAETSFDSMIKVTQPHDAKKPRPA